MQATCRKCGQVVDLNQGGYVGRHHDGLRVCSGSFSRSVEFRSKETRARRRAKRRREREIEQREQQRLANRCRCSKLVDGTPSYGNPDCPVHGLPPEERVWERS